MRLQLKCRLLFGHRSITFYARLTLSKLSRVTVRSSPPTFSSMPSARNRSRTEPWAPMMRRAMPRPASSACSSCSMREPARSRYGDAERSQTARRMADGCSFAKAVQDRFQDGIGIDVNQRRFGTKDDHAGQRLVLGMAVQVGIAVGAGNTAKKRNVRARYPGQQQQYGGQRSKQNALKYSKKQHADEGDGRGQEIQPAHSPHAEQCRKIQQAHTPRSTPLRPVPPSEDFQASRSETADKAPSVIEAKTSASGVRAPALSFTADCERPPATGKPCPSRPQDWPHRCPGVPASGPAVSMLCSEGAGRGHAFDIGQQQAPRGQRNDALDVAQPQRRACQAGQARRDFSCRGHPERRQPQQRRNGDRQRDNAERDRFSRKHRSPIPAAGSRYPDARTRYCVCPSCPARVKARSKNCAATLHAEQARQLSHRDRQASAGLEPHQNAVADQLYQHAQPQQPGDQAEGRDRERRKAGDLCIAFDVSLRHCSDRPGNHQRDRRSGSDGELARRSQ